MSILTKQKVMSQVMTLMESGLSPEEIAKTMQAEREKALLGESESDEEFTPEIRTLSQALAFRAGTSVDIPLIWKLLNKAYGAEVSGPESFRTGEAVQLETIRQLFEDTNYRWIVMEAPNGHDEENDGIILGVCCFSTNGVSRRNGEIEGLLGSIRYLGVLPRYHGLCAGLRLLRRVEREMAKSSCVRSMVSLPSPRSKLLDWIERRGYECVNEIPYPVSLGHELTQDDVLLLLFVKSLKAAPIKAEAIEDDSQVPAVASATAGAAGVAGAKVLESGATKPKSVKPAAKPSKIFAVSEPLEMNLNGTECSGDESGTQGPAAVDIPEVD